MKKYNTSLEWFTLIEIIVTISIISIIMVSIIATFMAVQQVTRSADIHRAMQENVKSIVERISADITESWIIWVSEDTTDPYGFATDWWKEWSGLETWSNKYYLAQQNTHGDWTRSTSSQCADISNNCILYVQHLWPITNSRVAVESIIWYMTKEPIPKVTWVLRLRPAVQKWIRSEIAAKNTETFQFTFAERILPNN